VVTEEIKKRLMVEMNSEKEWEKGGSVVFQVNSQENAWELLFQLVFLFCYSMNHLTNLWS
jgi:negative regulator of genetic competence, sporulation and motility